MLEVDETDGVDIHVSKLRTFMTTCNDFLLDFSHQSYLYTYIFIILSHAICLSQSKRRATSRNFKIRDLRTTIPTPSLVSRPPGHLANFRAIVCHISVSLAA